MLNGKGSFACMLQTATKWYKMVIMTLVVGDHVAAFRSRNWRACDEYTQNGR